MKNSENNHFGKLYHKIVDSGIWALLKPREKAVYIDLVRHANFGTGICRPSRKTIARGSGVYISEISKVTASLEKVGLIKKWKHNNRVYYHIIQEIEIKGDMCPQITDTYLKRKGEISYKRDKRTGKFESASVKHGIPGEGTPQITEYPLPQNTDAPLPQITDTGIETRNRDIRNRDNQKTQNPLSFSNNETTKPSWVTSDFGAYHFFSVEYRQELYRKHGKEGKDKLINAALKFGLVDREFDNPLSEQELAKITECIESEGKDGKEI